MQSRKRARDNNPLDEDASEGETQVRIHRDVSQKRSRLAMAAARGGSVVSDDTGDEDGVRPDERMYLESSPTADSGDEGEVVIQSDILDSTSEDDDDDGGEEDMNHEMATQAMRRALNVDQENVPAEQGIIEDVFCRNFMCHSKLRIKLGPLINFIIGHNGSGKSAVLTALTMCLGGKATSTNRGASLKSLIKEGEDTAMLAVKIRNRGEGAYKPQLYGDSITVERHFSRAGTSAFKIKNSEDKVISTKKADLDDICDFFAFQLDNPINVLNQDMARQFLANSTPGEKYKFFIRGTQLETLDTDYRLMEEHVDNIRAKLQVRKGDIDILKAKADEAEAKRKRLQEAGALQEKIAHCRRMHAWAQVAEQEAVLTLLDGDLAAAEERIRQKEQVGIDMSAEFDGQDQNFNSAQNQVNMLEEQLQPVRDEFTKAKEDFTENAAKLQDAKTEQRRIRGDVKGHQKNVETLEAQIRGEQIRLQAMEGTAHLDRIQILDDLKQAAEEAKSRYESFGSMKPLLDKKNDAEKDERAARSEAAEKREAYERAEAQLNSMQQSQGRQFDGYHHNMANLVRAVQQETRWRETPIGPLGAHIRLVNLDWQPQLERLLNELLPAFAVTSNTDKDLLFSIMRRVNCIQNVYVGGSRPLDTTPNEPPSEITTMLRVMRIDNDLVRNTIIVNASAEQIALTPDKHDAQAMVHGLRKVRNVRSAVAYGADRSSGVRFEMTRANQVKAVPVPKFPGRGRMKTDREAQIRVERQRVEVAKEQFNRADQNCNRLRGDKVKIEQELVRFRKQQNDLKIKMQEADDQVQQQQTEIDDNVPQDGKLQELERQLTEAKAELESSSNSFQDSVNSTDTLGENGRTLKTIMDEAESKVKAGETQLRSAEERKTKAGADRHQALLAKNEALQVIDDVKKRAERINERRETQKVTIEEFIQGASQISARVPLEDGVNTDILDQRIADFTKLYTQREREAGGTREQLTAKANATDKEYRAAVKQIKDMDTLQATLVRTLANRRHRWIKFRQHIVSRTRYNFIYLLSERSFRGEVLVNDTTKELDIKVEPDMAKASDAGRETRTLSGGEKSFSTICLLLSIWEAMGSPIRCLDEFDVFMDSVNRQASMAMMIGAARRSVGKQFILITPQAMNNVTLGEDVRIHRMSDPERGQTTLSLEAVR